VLTQTTLSVDEAMRVMNVLKRRFPALATPRKEDICYATTNRQMAVKSLRGKVDLWLVIGDRMSSNSNRLRELGADSGVPATWCSGPPRSCRNGSPASCGRHHLGREHAGEQRVRAVVERLRELGATSVEEVDGIPETVEFSLPLEFVR
jgi:4-hydroxy-3-methylbut-2-enyl diphosphate reductase